jgi:hypothetical protein
MLVVSRCLVGRILAALVTSLLIAWAPPALADEWLDEPAFVSAVVSHGSVQAWSRYIDGEGYVLVLRRDGRTEVAPVRPRGVPFDVDLGPGPNGRVVAVYSRCRGEPDRVYGFPTYYTGTDCRLYRVDVASGRERRLSGGSYGRSEYLPTIWRERLAFARTYEGRGDRPGSGPHVYVRRGNGRSQRMPAGPRGEIRTIGPMRLDLRRGRLVVGWEHVKRSRPGRGLGWGPDHITSIQTFTSRGRRTVVDRVRAGPQQRRLALPSLFRGKVHYGISSPFGDDEYRVYDLDSGQRERSAAPSDLFSVSRSAGGLFYSLFVYGERGFGCGSDRGNCRIAQARG